MDDGTGDCTKYHPDHAKLLPGIFTLFCQHGICFGFRVMTTSESPNVLFSLLKTRFKKGEPY